MLGPPSLATRTSDEVAFVGGDGVPEWKARRGLLVEEQLEELRAYLYSTEWREAVGAELTRAPADIFVCDQQLADAAVAAGAFGIPTALVSVILFQPWYNLYGNFGLRGETTADVLGRVAVNLVLAPAELDFAGDTPRNVRYVGPVADPDPPEPFESPWAGDDGRPLVVISFSTDYQRQEPALAEVVEAVADLPVRALLLAGKGLDVPTPAGIHVSEWVPHAAVMPAASLCITHGGLGTIQSALACGVPLLVMPHIFEQAVNGHRVSEIGAGMLVSAEARSAEIRASVVELLGRPSFRQAAEEASAWFEDGGDRAVAALEALAGGV